MSQNSVSESTKRNLPWKYTHQWGSPMTMMMNFNETFLNRLMSFGGGWHQWQLNRIRVRGLKSLYSTKNDFSFSVTMLVERGLKENLWFPWSKQITNKILKAPLFDWKYRKLFMSIWNSIEPIERNICRLYSSCLLETYMYDNLFVNVKYHSTVFSVSIYQFLMSSINFLSFNYKDWFLFDALN